MPKKIRLELPAGESVNLGPAGAQIVSSGYLVDLELAAKLAEEQLQEIERELAELGTEDSDK